MNNAFLDSMMVRVGLPVEVVAHRDMGRIHWKKKCGVASEEKTAHQW
jgi:hypothetical protein